MSSFDAPVPLSEIEAVLAWVDSFKLSRTTKKINRDFSDAVLLAEMLSVHYPKLVEMHNYPPRNSQALKLNNWMTLNRKVLKKLKVSLCCSTMEQLANCTPGVIERVLIMVYDKVRRDEEINRSMKDSEQNMSSGGSYYEACGDDEQVLVVPVKTRVNGVLETVQQKVVSHSIFAAMKEELKDARETTDVLKQKVEHLDSLLKLKDERIEELQRQLDRKVNRRKEVEVFQNTLNVPFDNVSSPTKAEDLKPVPKTKDEEEARTSKIPKAKTFEDVPKLSALKNEVQDKLEEITTLPASVEEIRQSYEIKQPEVKMSIEELVKKSSHSLQSINIDAKQIKRSGQDLKICKSAEEIRSDSNATDEKSDGFQDSEDFKEVEQIVTIEDSIHTEIKGINRSLTNCNAD